MRTPIILAAVLFLMGCGSGVAVEAPDVEGPADVATETTDEGPIPTTAPVREEPAGAKLALSGRWDSAECGDRKHLRWIKFYDNGDFTGADEVSPCPPKAKCVWSGIVRWNGKWAREGDTVKLVAKTAPKGGPGGANAMVQLPNELTVIKGDPATIAESAGGSECPYVKR